MSQHLYPATYEGEPVSVLIGFDRPLRGFFMVIDKTTPASAGKASEEGDDDHVYSNLDDQELDPWDGLPPTMDHFLRTLKGLDIPALPNVIAEVQADQAGNVGNRTVRYDAAGNVLGNQAGKENLRLAAHPGLPAGAGRHNKGIPVLRKNIETPAGEGGQAAQQDAPEARVYALLADAAAHFRDALRAVPDGRQYLQGRGISGATAGRFGLGFARREWQDLRDVIERHDEDTAMASGLLAQSGDNDNGRRYDRFRGRVMFPIRDRAGRVAGFGGRVLDGTDPKYLNSPEGPTFRKREMLYGLYEAEATIAAAGLALVVEGYMDVVSLSEAGFRASVGTLGTACTSEQLALLLEVTSSIVFCFDGDAAGRRAAARALENVLPLATSDRSIRFVFLPPEHDPDSFVRAHGLTAFEAAVQGSATLAQFLTELVTDGCELQYAEGRSRCASLARPYWLALPAGAIKDGLRDHCAEILKFPPADVETLWLAN